MLIFIVLVSIFITIMLLGAGIFPFTIAAVAAILCFICILLNRKQDFPQAGVLSFLVSVLIIVLTVTVIPLPSSISGIFGPERAKQNLIAEKAINNAVALGITNVSTPLFALTRNRAGTARMILLLIAGFSVATLSSRMPPTWKDRYLKFMILSGVVLAVAGFISQWVIPQGKNIWWLFPVPHGRPVGCFINRNHFGGFIAIMCAPAVFMMSDSIEKKRYASVLTWCACLIALNIAVILSLSKGAWLALITSMSFSFMVLSLRKHITAVILFAAVFIISGCILLLNPHQQISERFKSMVNFKQNQSVEMRLSTWHDSLAILRDYPVMGIGANAFRMIFPQYRSATTRKPFEHIENEYLQIPVEFGLPATAVIIAILFCTAKRCQETWQVEKNVTILLCVGGMLVAVAVHALTDFALRIPLYFLTVCSMIGLAISPGVPCTVEHSNRHTFSILLPAGALVIIAGLSCMGKEIYQLDSTDHLDTAANDRICRALSWSPTSWHAWYQLGKTAVTLKTDNACRFGENCLTQSVKYDPNNYLIWQELSLLRLSLQDLDGAREAYKHVKKLRAWKQIKELEEQPSPQ
ncbi:MAG: O-antigen ligase family protein [Kiritimatiellae bacterium]|nr:O-antigen ligase family protein [Kiritimatiellia bacterium]MDD5520340.1 O-antigen ligase family protein [Kiritimatiellia bacterium]